jgi:predicted cupin superfamily sugar epimerase
MHPRAAQLVRSLGLTPHPEGGHYSETWRSAGRVPAASLIPGAGGERPAGTAIYYLLAGEDRSRLHRLRVDEVWHHYEGGPLRLHLLPPGGAYHDVVLGDPFTANPRWQCVVPAGWWFGAELTENDDFALAGCTLAPGFDDADFELADREALAAAFPGQADLIRRLT